MKRKIENFLLEWKNRENHLPLIVKGARQIKKTYSITKFGKSNYKNFIEINFSTKEAFRSIFDNGLEIDAIIKMIFILK